MSDAKNSSNFCTYEQGMFPEKLHRSFGDSPLDEFWEQEATAIHEAGHAVAAWLLGIEYQSIEITMHTCGERLIAWSGACIADEDRRFLKLPRGYGPIYRVHGIIALAGPAAERKYRLFHDLPMHKGNGGDHEMFDNQLGKSLEAAGRNSYAFSRMIWRRAQTIMEIEQVWDAVSELGLRLTSLMDEEIDATDGTPPRPITVSLPGSEVARAAHDSRLEKLVTKNVFACGSMTSRS